MKALREAAVFRTREFAFVPPGAVEVVAQGLPPLVCRCNSLAYLWLVLGCLAESLPHRESSFRCLANEHAIRTCGDGSHCGFCRRCHPFDCAHFEVVRDHDARKAQLLSNHGVQEKGVEARG